MRCQLISLILLAVATAASAAALPKSDLEFLRGMTREVIEASSVPPGSNGGGTWGLTNACGFTLITPGKDTYHAFWIRDLSMSAESGLVSAAALSNHLVLICQAQNGPSERPLTNGLHVPPWAIPDHINYNGQPVFYPGTYASGEDQGNGTWGRVPPIDDHFEFVNLAYISWTKTRNRALLKQQINGLSIYDRLEMAFLSPTTDAVTGLADTTKADRAVGFGFCDAETHTGKLLFASLLRYRAAGEMVELSRAAGLGGRAARFRQIQTLIRENLVRTFADPLAIGGWLRASTDLSRQPDVWGTLFALHLNVLGRREATAARKTIADAVRRGTIEYEGGVRHVPTDMDFGASTAWERSGSALNTYQNGAYWHTASGWLIEQLWKKDRKLAQQVFSKLIDHLRTQDFRKGSGHGAPWEAFGRDGHGRQNPVYMASVALPYGILKKL